MSEVTRILQEIEVGTPHAAEKLLPLVYDELRKLAAGYLSKEAAGQTLQPTALVHEAYLRLVGGNSPDAWDHRGHFFAAAATAIRRILIENARRKSRHKHGGRLVRRELEENHLVVFAEPHEDVLALDEALRKLTTIDPQATELVELTYFAGLTLPETAQLLGISSRTASRLWVFARAWLRDEMEGDGRRGENF